MTPEKILYTAQSTATGGRDGRARSSDGALDVALATPRELGGAGGAGTNPEQLFAAGYSACFLSALKFVAGKQKVALPRRLAHHRQRRHRSHPDRFRLDVQLDISIPGLPKEQVQQLVEAAHQVCPLLERHPRQHQREVARRLNQNHQHANPRKVAMNASTSQSATSTTITTRDGVQLYYKDWGPAERPGRHVQPRLAAEFRQLGIADAVPGRQGLPRRRA